MEPPEDTLPTTIEHLQPSVLVIALRLLAALFMLDVIYSVLVLGFLGLNNLHDWHTTYVLVLFALNIAKYFLISVVVVRLFADWAGRSYYLSGHHLIERLGLINITETTYELSQVKSLVVNQTWLGRRFNYGTIKLSLAGSGKPQIILLREINNPRRYKDYIEQHLQVQGWVR